MRKDLIKLEIKCRQGKKQAQIQDGQGVGNYMKRSISRDKKNR